MLVPAPRPIDTMPATHPCLDCEVRTRSICRVLECAELADLKGLSWTVTLAPGQPLFHEGDPVKRVYTLTRGCIKLYKLLPDGRRQVTGFMFPGDFLGISVESEHAFTAESLTESELCGFPRSRFDGFVDCHGEMERELYRVAANELAAAQQQMVLLGRKTAAERLASFFLLLAAKARMTRGTGPRILDLPMNRTDIADYLGLTKETVSRMLSLLKRERVIRLAALDRVEVLDWEGLVEIADGGLEF